MPTDRFEVLYGTPHGIDLVALAKAYGTTAKPSEDVSGDVAAALRAGGVHVLVVASDREGNRALHTRLNDAVATAVAPA